MNLMNLFSGWVGVQKNMRRTGAEIAKKAIFFAFSGGRIVVHSDTSSTSGRFLVENREKTLSWMYLMYMYVHTLCIGAFCKVGLFCSFFGSLDVLRMYIEVHRSWRFV
jgi:hypothetical protein